MARIAEARPPAAPVSKDQVARRDRILDTAAELGAGAGFDRMQMNDVAKEAGVALGTLYRYFPSKTHLFSAVFAAHVSRFTEQEWPGGGEDPIEDVGAGLVALGRELMTRPKLGAAMVRAAAAGYAGDSIDAGEDRQAESTLFRAILNTLDIRTPTGEDRTLVRLLVYSWWGVLVSSLSRKTSAEQADAEIRTAARLILAPYAR